MRQDAEWYFVLGICRHHGHRYVVLASAVRYGTGTEGRHCRCWRHALRTYRFCSGCPCVLCGSSHEDLESHLVIVNACWRDDITNTQNNSPAVRRVSPFFLLLLQPSVCGGGRLAPTTSARCRHNRSTRSLRKVLCKGTADGYVVQPITTGLIWIIYLSGF